jgi:tRNA threonylcarbamoyladenosine biosynthesis protein TsaB
MSSLNRVYRPATDCVIILVNTGPVPKEFNGVKLPQFIKYMTTILAIDTATDACSVALYKTGKYTECYEVIPRSHSQRLLPMLQSLLPSGDLRALGIDAIAYGCGPGSFTGLRIAASAVQGLAYANSIPAVSVSTLACQAQNAVRNGLAKPGDCLFSTIDARINEIYWSSYIVQGDSIIEQAGPNVCTPGDIPPLTLEGDLVAIGSGLKHAGAMPAALTESFAALYPDLLPSARDLVPLALEKLERGETQQAHEVLPVYVRDEISWKKLSEQGKQV